MDTKISLAPDGSKRKFFLVEHNGQLLVKIVPAPGAEGKKEAASFVALARHLFSANVPVPQVVDFEPATGIILVEYIKGLHLQTYVQSRIKEKGWQDILPLYANILKILVNMQVRGYENFDVKWCWDTPFYTGKFAFEKEVLYFRDFFLKRFMGLDLSTEAEGELYGLSLAVDRIKRIYFMHRDFQSRNILLGPEPYVIDFQGGRLGPLGYDLASFLYDPYVAMPYEIRLELLNQYLACLKSEGIEDNNFPNHFFLLAFLRILQTLGAYAFLSIRRKRLFFVQFIKPALLNLREIVRMPYFADFQHVRTLIENITVKYEKKHS